jgi:hypothetical protein
MGGRFAFVVVGLMGGCAAPPVQEAVQPAPAQEVAKVETKEAPVVDGFEAVVRVDEKPGGKKFQGVWLERADGERWVVAYRPLEWLKLFEGRTVRVTGATYEPFGQAINATHFKIATLAVTDKQGGLGPLLGVGPELTLAGRFVEAKGEAGTKSEGATWWTFVAADGAAYEIEGTLAEIAAGAVTVVARKVEPDGSYAARRGADFLWVIEIKKP